MADEPANGTVVDAPPADDWRATLPDDLKADPSLKDFKDVGSLATSYVADKKKLGEALRSTGLKAPADDAPDEEWGAYYAKLGRPETPDKYGFPVPTLPEGMGEVDPDGVAQFRKEAHAAGLTDRQAGRLMSWYATYHVSGVDKLTEHTAAERKTAVAALKTEWGAAYDRNVSLARQATKDLFEDDPQIAHAIENAGNNVALLKGLARIGERMLEHGEITGVMPAGETLDSVRATLEAMRAEKDPQNWPKDKQDRYAALIQQEFRLQQRARR